MIEQQTLERSRQALLQFIEDCKQGGEASHGVPVAACDRANGAKIRRFGLSGEIERGTEAGDGVLEASNRRGLHVTPKHRSPFYGD